MNKLAALRANLLATDCPLKLKAASLLTWAERGKLTSWRGEPGANRNFAITYTAHVVVVGFTGQPMDLFFRVLDWLQEDNPAAAEDDIGFHVDLPDQKTADVEFTIELSETIAAEVTPQGLRLAAAPDADVRNVELQSLFDELNQSG